MEPASKKPRTEEGTEGSSAPVLVVGKKKNPLVTAMLTDFYQLTMGYAYFKAGKMEDIAVFDLYFRKNPFEGEFTIFAGLSDVLSFLQDFRFTEEDIEYLKSVMPVATQPEYFDYLRGVDARQIKVFAVPEGTVMFPSVPLMRIEGPLAIVQLLETPLLNLVNFASLVTTNAARFRHAVGDDVTLLEFGLRRAQGPDGGLTASRYCYMGGFDATSNVLAGQLYGVPVAGTHAHAFVSSFAKGEDMRGAQMRLTSADGSSECTDFMATVNKHWKVLVADGPNFSKSSVDPNQGELLAFATYAHAFPTAFVALVDTYNVMQSGMTNFCAVALALSDSGYTAKGIRLDSGDLAYLSMQARTYLKHVATLSGQAFIGDCTIVASNDINEATLYSLATQGHEINAFGVGTHLVTCQAQPALGCVFKLVELNGEPRMKISQDVAKVTIPGRKETYRLYGKDGVPLVDLMMTDSEPAPIPGERALCRHPFVESKRAYVIPTRVEKLYSCRFDSGKPNLADAGKTLKEIKEYTAKQIHEMRNDHLRNMNPTPYKVSVSDKLYKHIHQLWLANTSVSELY